MFRLQSLQLHAGVHQAHAAHVSTRWCALLQDAARGLLFIDAGSDLNSGQTVTGDPAGTRGKPGHGYGYGLGVRVKSPMGMIRFEYGWSDKVSWREGGRAALGAGKLHVGIGSRF